MEANMAHKTFISYKYSESRELRDKIIKALGKDATYYKGENVNSKDMTDLKRKTIEKNLADMMYDTSVTIVILSPEMKKSDWIGWEISYCLKKSARKGRTSQRNGVVAVIKKVNGGYSWFKYSTDSGTKYHMDKIQTIIAKNHFNSNPPIKTNEGMYDWLNGSYITFVEEEDFLKYPKKYIDNAYEKSENDGKGYDLRITE